MKKNNIGFQDFMNVDLRVGKVVSAKRIENSKKLLELMVDLGEDYGTVTILTGMAEYYEPAFFVERHYIFVTNMEPKPMAGSVSNGMILAADVAERPIPLEVSGTITAGTVVR